jgi:transcriptional antiterminator RfaH
MNWYCIHTRALKEQQIAGYLRERLSLETYSPLMKTQKNVRRALRTVVSPLFPRYLFCRFDLATQYRAVRYTPEVIDVVSFGAQPAVVSTPLIEELKNWAGDMVDLCAPARKFQSGDRVEIADGPMQGLSAVILNERNDDHRVAVLLSSLECGAKLIVNRSQLKFSDSANNYSPSTLRWASALAS